MSMFSSGATQFSTTQLTSSVRQWNVKERFNGVG